MEMPRSPTATGRVGRGPGSNDLPIVEAARRAGLDQAQTTAVTNAMLKVMNNLPRLITQNRLDIWRTSRTAAQRKPVVDHVAGAIIAERLMTGVQEFLETQDEVEDLARRRLRSSVRFVQGAVQAQTGSSFEVTPGQETPERRAPRSSQLSDGMFVVVVDQMINRRPTGAKDLYVLGVAEVKLKSQIPYLPNQVSKTHERLTLGVQLGNDVYLEAEHAKPGQNRLFTAADLQAPMRWVIAAPSDALPPGTKVGLEQRTSDRGAERPKRSVRVATLPMPNEAIRRYATHLLDILTEDEEQPASPRR
jgi:hypothetical protein